MTHPASKALVCLPARLPRLPSQSTSGDHVTEMWRSSKLTKPCVAKLARDLASLLPSSLRAVLNVPSELERGALASVHAIAVVCESHEPCILDRVILDRRIRTICPQPDGELFMRVRDLWQYTLSMRVVHSTSFLTDRISLNPECVEVHARPRGGDVQKGAGCASFKTRTRIQHTCFEAYILLVRLLDLIPINGVLLVSTVDAAIKVVSWIKHPTDSLRYVSMVSRLLFVALNVPIILQD